MNITNGILAVLVALLVAACGGGSANSGAPAETPVADATLVGKNNNSVVTPGETFVISALQVTCPQMQGTTSCAKEVPLGELGIRTDLALQDVKVLHDGYVVSGFVRRDTSFYRFEFLNYEAIYQPGSITVVATLSPSAQSGLTSGTEVRASTSSFDKTLIVVSGQSTITVFARPEYAPAQITPVVDDNGLTTGFQYACPSTVVSGCTLSQFTFAVVGAAPATDVRLYQDGLLLGTVQTDQAGFVSASLNPAVSPGVDSVSPFGALSVVPRGQASKFRVEVASAGTQPNGLWFSNFTSVSDGKEIAPLLPTGCTGVTPEGCKG